MPVRPPVLALALALLAPSPGRAPARQPAAGAEAPVEFRLNDQFGRAHDASDYRGRSFLLVGAGRGGRAAGTAWVERLRAMQGDSTAAAVPVVAVADLRGVPRLLRRMVRGRFPHDPRQAVLLDWDGSLARRLAFDAEQCSLVLVDPTGRPHAVTHTATVDTARARAILREAATLSTTAAAEPLR